MKHLPFRAAFLTVVGAAALTLAACGDDAGTNDTGNSSTSTPASTSTTSPASNASTPEAAATEVTVEHYSGTDTVPVNPETVAVFDIGVLLTLHELGVEVDALGGLAAPVPDEYASIVANPAFTPVGTAFEPDYEAVNALEPDLIIVATRSSATYPEMKKIAPTVDLTLNEGDYMESLRQQLETIGEIFGVQEAVAAKLAELEAEIDEISAQTADAGSALIVMTNGNEVSAYGPGSRFGLVHDVLGYAAADETLEREATHGDVVSFEFVLEAQPEVLFVVDRTAAVGQEGPGAQAVLDNELVHQTPAWQNGRVVYVDSFSWYIASNSLPAMFQILEDVRASLS